MPATSLTGQDTAQIDGIILQTLADGNAWDITFPQDLAAVKVGKNGNAIYAKNEQGRRADVTLRVLLGGVDDKYLIAKIAQWKADPSLFQLIVGLFIKKVGDGQGNVQSEVYNCTGGVIQKQPEAKTATEGDTDQSVHTFVINFTNCEISVQ